MAEASGVRCMVYSSSALARARARARAVGSVAVGGS